jgi:putative membrane protein
VTSDVSFWTAGWKPDLLVAVPLVLSGALYCVGLINLWRRSTTGAGVRWSEVTAFAAGWVTLAIALLSPIATMSELLFSIHMTQHELLMLVAAPLLTLGRPLVPMLWALPERWRLKTKGRLGMAAAVRHLTSPFVVFALHTAALWIWHVPFLFEAAVLDDRVHAVQHLSFTGTACLFWWGLLRGRYGRLGYGTAVVYVFATAVHSGGLGALLTLSPQPWYSLYVDRSHHGADALADQQLAGLIMWIPAGAILMLFGLAIFAAWIGEAERRRRVTAR